MLSLTGETESERIGHRFAELGTSRLRVLVGQKRVRQLLCQLRGQAIELRLPVCKKAKVSDMW